MHTNLLNAIVAGTGAPDLCAIDVLRLTQYIDGLVDLSAHRAEYEDYFVPPTLDLGSYQGKLYGLATDSEPIGLLYRKDIWDQYGIAEEDIETWADLAEAGNKVNQDSGGEVSLYAMFGERLLSCTRSSPSSRASPATTSTTPTPRSSSTIRRASRRRR